MFEIISGVYRIVNVLTGEQYIGASSNIHNRWKSHRMHFNNCLSKEFTKPLYVAMREFGLDNFIFEILEEVDVENIFLREKEYIEKTYLSKSPMYNREHRKGWHWKAAVTIEDVIDIRSRYAEQESKRNVYADYKSMIGLRGFHKIWNGYTWPEIMPEVYSEENKKFHKFNTGNAGEQNGRTRLTNDEILSIRNRKENGENAKDVHKEYADRIKLRSFMNTWHGYNWKHITA